MKSDNRKTFRLDDESQNIITELKEKRGCTENDVVNFLIKQYEPQGKIITELHNKRLQLENQLSEIKKEADRAKAELREIKEKLAFVGGLLVIKQETNP